MTYPPPPPNDNKTGPTACPPVAWLCIDHKSPYKLNESDYHDVVAITESYLEELRRRFIPRSSK